MIPMTTLSLSVSSPVAKETEEASEAGCGRKDVRFDVLFYCLVYCYHKIFKICARLVVQNQCKTRMVVKWSIPEENRFKMTKILTYKQV